MPLIDKIRDLCKYNNISITKLEEILGFGNGSITKNPTRTMRSDRVVKVANYFNVTPTYLTTDMVYCVCPVCAAAYNPLDRATIESHDIIHENFVNMRKEIGYLLNPSQAATKRVIAQKSLESGDNNDDGKTFHYETLVQCDFADYAYENKYEIDIPYYDFLRSEIRAMKYFDLVSETVRKNLLVKYNVEPDTGEDTPLIELFQEDKEFMTNITDLWDLPRDLRVDVYKAIRHAKRDYADREYYTNPYANTTIRA